MSIIPVLEIIQGRIMSANSDLEKFKSLIIKISDKVNQYKLRNLLIIIAASTLAASICIRNIPITEYDCSDKGDSVAKMIISCEEQRTNEKIKKMEIELEEKKLDARNEFEKLVAVIKAVNWEDPNSRSSFLRTLSSKSLSKMELLTKRNSCSEQMIESMCKVVKK